MDGNRKTSRWGMCGVEEGGGGILFSSVLLCKRWSPSNTTCFVFGGVGVHTSPLRGSGMAMSSLGFVSHSPATKFCVTAGLLPLIVSGSHVAAKGKSQGQCRAAGPPGFLTGPCTVNHCWSMQGAEAEENTRLRVEEHGCLQFRGCFEGRGQSKVLLRPVVQPPRNKAPNSCLLLHTRAQLGVRDSGMGFTESEPVDVLLSGAVWRIVLGDGGQLLLRVEHIRTDRGRVHRGETRHGADPADRRAGI